MNVKEKKYVVIIIVIVKRVCVNVVVKQEVKQGLKKRIIVC
jgi:hypothetical protein